MAWACAKLLAVLPALALLAACGPAPQAPPQAAQADPAIQDAASGAYGRKITLIVRSDIALTQILVSQHVTGTLEIALIVDPDGRVERGYVLRSGGLPQAELAVLAHLLSEHFGRFYPGMPRHSVLVLVPVQAPVLI